MTEFINYVGLPHLFYKIANTIEEIEQILNSLILEMNKRKIILSNAKVKKISEYKGKDLPYIVVFIDEFADIIMQSKKTNIETNINLLVSQARFCGIHLIIATQRPSVDIITGVIKANIPVRIAFKVINGIDSTVILGQNGAENLKNVGDFIFKGYGNTKNLKAFLIKNNEINKIVKDKKEEFFITNFKKIEIPPTLQEKEIFVFNDPLAKEILLYLSEGNFKTITTKEIRSKFKIGSERTTKILNELENKKFLGTKNGNKPRQVLAFTKN